MQFLYGKKPKLKKLRLINRIKMYRLMIVSILRYSFDRITFIIRVSLSAVNPFFNKAMLFAIFVKIFTI